MHAIRRAALGAVAVVFVAASPSHAEHRHVPPHGGTLVELGPELAHVELVLDPHAGKLTAYVLDGEAENAVRIRARQLELSLRDVKRGPGFPVPPQGSKVVLEAIGNVLTGETPGDTSQFEAETPTLTGVLAFQGALTRLEVRGAAFERVTFSFPAGNEPAGAGSR
ncbi:MAG TPA: hypothetical protein VMW35_01935 [Myxococcota bacterium]|jgi:hypothetical protein|nr:hypothetical protein [Myxococcota bacterium]